MDNEEFEALLVRRAVLRGEHREWCDDVNGYFGTGEGSYESKRRDQSYRELREVEEMIEKALEDERNEE